MGNTAQSVTRANVEMLPVDRIIVKSRRRKSLGSLKGLVRSIEAHGLIHPILVRNGCELVAGARRLEAHRQLGLKMIAARHVEQMSDDELRAIEFDENAHRLALTDYEGSKQRLAQMRQAEAELEAKAANTVPTRNRKRGQPKKPGSRRDVEKITGVPIAEQVRVEKHVALAQQYPVLQRAGWVQHQVLHAGEELKKLPETDRGQVAALLDQAGIPPKTAIQMLEHVAEMPTADRKEMLRLASSDSPHERDTALTMARNVPPPPDPALNHLREAHAKTKRASEVCITAAFRPRLKALHNLVATVVSEFTDAVRRHQA